MIKYSITLSCILFLSIQIHAEVGETFITSIADGIEMTFKITGENEVQVGNGTSTAINTTTSGSVEIPAIVADNGVNYRVTSIGRNAFSDCKSLEVIDIPSSVIEIGWGAFCGSGLTSMTIPNSVKYLDDEVFRECQKLTTVTIGDGVTAIGWSTFNFCYALTTVSIGKNVKCFGGYSFQSCRNLKSITIPNGVKEIGDYAFCGCTQLTTIDIPEGVETIGESAFSGCYNLSTITIPKSVNSIGYNAFNSTRWDLYLPKGLNYAGLVAYKYKGQLPANGEIQIKEGTKGIAGGAFYLCDNLTSVTIPDGVTSIGSRAFYGCSELSSIDIPNSVANIGSKAFSETKWYKNHPDGLVYAGMVVYDYKGLLPKDGIVILKEGTTGIAEKAFQNCNDLTSVTIPSNLKVIGAYAFDGCGQLSSLTIPESVEYIGYFAFQHYPVMTMTSVYVEWTTPILLDSSVFYDGYNSYCDKLTLYVPKGTKSAYENAQYWKEFKEIVEYSINNIEAINNFRHNFTENPSVFTIDGKPVVGVPVSRLPKGLYVIGNKKVMVK